MEDHNLLVVSDLHLSEGFDSATGKFSRLEDFWFGDAFARFLRYHEGVRGQPRFGGRPWMLIINGDLFDFLQVVSLPEEDRLLRTIRDFTSHRDLSVNERDFGLGTTAAESEWKLKQIARGHQHFFAALGWFVAHGNHVTVLKGNHDVDLHWPQVQERFVAEVQRAYTRERLALDHGPALSAQEVHDCLHFHPWFYYEPGRIYVEHGGQYEALNHFRDYLNPVLPDDPTRIELPWGSLFVRYLFNRIELVHPFADNVKPVTRYVGWAFRTDPVGTIELLVTHSWVFLRSFWNVARKTMAAVFRKGEAQVQSSKPEPLPLPAEVVAEIAALAQHRVGAVWQEWIASAVQGLLSLLMALITITFVVLAVLTLSGGLSWMTALYLGSAALAYFLGRGLKRSFASLIESDYLLGAARGLERLLSPAHAVQYVVMGHSHHAALERMERSWYVNTGAWVPVFEEQGGTEGHEKLTFFRLAQGHEGMPELLKWDDAAGAPTHLVLWPDA